MGDSTPVNLQQLRLSIGVLDFCSLSPLAFCSCCLSMTVNELSLLKGKRLFTLVFLSLSSKPNLCEYFFTASVESCMWFALLSVETLLTFLLHACASLNYSQDW